MFENCEERPRDRDRGREITFWCRECVCSRSGLKEEQCEEDENFRPHTRGLFQGIDTESLECREYHEDSRPAVVKREGKMYEEFIQAICRSMELLDDVIDVRNCGTDKEGKNERSYIVARSPRFHIE